MFITTIYKIRDNINEHKQLELSIIDRSKLLLSGSQVQSP